MSAKPIRSGTEFLRHYFPKEYARRKAEGRCIHCGALHPRAPWSKDPSRAR